jgi:ABC-2 type transport system permease protein
MGERVRAAEDLPAAQKLILTTFFGALDSFLGQLDFGAGEGGAAAAIEPRIETVAVARERSGPPNAYSVSFPQSILWAILGAAAGFAITLVRERSSGTMVRLLSAPISRSAVLAGKALACFLTICEVGSVALLALGTASAGACFAGIAMLLSALGRTEQAVGGLAWGVLIVLAMLGGGMVPQIAMPAWMLSAGAISPARWTVQALEGAIWRGFTLGEMLLPCAVLLGFGALAFAVGAGRLRRESS